jgi:hypothetical protein
MAGIAVLSVALTGLLAGCGGSSSISASTASGSASSAKAGAGTKTGGAADPKTGGTTLGAPAAARTRPAIAAQHQSGCDGTQFTQHSAAALTQLSSQLIQPYKADQAKATAPDKIPGYRKSLGEIRNNLQSARADVAGCPEIDLLTGVLDQNLGFLGRFDAELAQGHIIAARFPAAEALSRNIPSQANLYGVRLSAGQ